MVSSDVVACPHTTGLSKQDLTQLLYDTLAANDMQSASDIHVRLMVTRGLKPTPYQNPNITVGHPTIVIVPEYKQVDDGAGVCTYMRQGYACTCVAFWLVALWLHYYYA